MEEKNKKQIRKFIKEVLSSDSIASLQNGELRPWLTYYSAFSKLGHTSMGHLYSILRDSTTSDEQKLLKLGELYKEYTFQLQALQTPGLN